MQTFTPRGCHRSTNELQEKETYTLTINLFLRKERGALRLAKLKLSNARYTYDLENIKLKSKLRELFFKWQNNQEILTVSNEVVKANKKLLKAEERKFYLGESFSVHGQ